MLAAQPVIDRASLLARVDDVLHAQDGELLRYRRPLHPKRLHELTDILLTTTKQLEDANPHRMRQRFEEVGLEALQRVWHQRLLDSINEVNAIAIVSGVGGQPGISRSTGSTSRTPPACSVVRPSRLHPIAQLPSAATKRRSGIDSEARINAVRMRVGTGPVTRTTSACRGEAAMLSPNRDMS